MRGSCTDNGGFCTHSFCTKRTLCTAPWLLLLAAAATLLLWVGGLSQLLMAVSLTPVFSSYHVAQTAPGG